MGYSNAIKSDFETLDIEMRFLDALNMQSMMMKLYCQNDSSRCKNAVWIV